MKTIILITALFLTVAFAGTVAAADQTNIRGYVVAAETYQVQPPTLIVDANGTGNYTFRNFTVTYHAEVDLTTGSAKGSAEFVSPNGDRLFTTFVGQGIDTGIPGWSYITEIFTVTGGTGRFNKATGNFTMERLLNLATGNTSGAFHGSIIQKR